MLYSVIVGCIKNRLLRLIMETSSRDGRDALRKLDAEYRPTYRGRQMALLKGIMHPKLNSVGSDAEHVDKLSERQQVVREYERISGSELDQSVKTATLIEEAAPQMQEHLRLRSEELGTDYKKVIQAIEGYVRSKNSGDTGGPVDMDIGAASKGKGQPKGKGRSKGKDKSDKGIGQPRGNGKGKGKGKGREPKNNEISKSDRKCFVLWEDWTFCQRLCHRVRTVNEGDKTAPVVTPMCAFTDSGHPLSHVCEQNTSVEHDWILALTVDMHSCSHVTASNMRPMVDSGAASHVCPSWYGFSPLSVSAKQFSPKSAGGDVMHPFGSKAESYVYRSLKFHLL